MIVHVVAFGIAQGSFEVKDSDSLRGKVFPRLEELDPDHMQSRKKIVVSHGRVDRSGDMKRSKVKLDPDSQLAQLGDDVREGDVIFVEHSK